MTTIPRRCDIDLRTPAEKAISDAINSVENLGADTKLTEAVTFLMQAREKVADYIDNKLGISEIKYE